MGDSKISITINNTNNYNNNIFKDYIKSVNKNSKLSIKLDSSSYLINSNPLNGTVLVNGNVLEYIPTLDYIGQDSFTYKKTNSEEVYTISILINNPINSSFLNNKINSVIDNSNLLNVGFYVEINDNYISTVTNNIEDYSTFSNTDKTNLVQDSLNETIEIIEEKLGDEKLNDKEVETLLPQILKETKDIPAKYTKIKLTNAENNDEINIESLSNEVVYTKLDSNKTVTYLLSSYT